MSAKAHPRYLPSITLLVMLVLAAYYLFVFLPLCGHTAAADKPLVAVWDRLTTATRSCEACAGLDLDGFPARLAQLRRSETNLDVAEGLVRSRIELPAEVRALTQLPFQLIDFQNERQRSVEALARLGGENGVSLAPGATNGLPEYSVDMVEPGMLWARLHMAHQLLLTALSCKVTQVKSLDQLPSFTHRAAADGAPFLEELPMRIELTGSMESVRRFLASLPLPAKELPSIGLPATLTNKPVLFLDRILLRKHAPDKPDEVPKPGDVQLEASVTTFAPWSAASSPGSP